MNKSGFLIILALISGFTFYSASFAGSGHLHEEVAKDEFERGPHDGRLFEQDDFALEITIYEQGIPPEMRIYAYFKKQAIHPDLVELEVTLQRLGNEYNKLQFSVENDYLVSNQTIAEPHSFDVEIKARYQAQDYDWHFSSHEGRTEISDRLIKQAQIQTEISGSQTLTFNHSFFGVIETAQDKVFRIHAPYEGLIKSVSVNVGDRVKKGQTLLHVVNNKTLQSYPIKSPSDGEVTSRRINAGDYASNEPLLVITDLSNVWVEMSAFPETIEKLEIGQVVTIYDLHQHKVVESKVTYVAPLMTGGHIARARTIIANPDGHWRPGMHIKAEIQVEQRQVPLAVRQSALQSFRGKPVVFAKYGNTFEVRMLELGASDGHFIEVLGGMRPWTEYVVGNSYLLKADVLKDGASHDH